MTDNRGWPLATLLTLVLLLMLLAIYGSTAYSLVATWTQSETFAHGFIIFPISAWLIWKKRAEVAAIAPAPNLFGLLPLCVLGFSWLMGHLGRVQVVQQYALILMLPVTVWTALGSRVTRSLAFPLAYLLFAVPFGEALIPYLIEYTADFTVFALRLTGIPVYREGAFFTVPSGNWSVVEACSGLRYLISSFTLGCLYAYLTYRSAGRRLLFAGISLAVPILANGLRAYMIVMIGHLSDMRLAVGIDHYIYGWVFFGLVMMLLFWVGTFWREDLAGEQTAMAALPPADVPVRRISATVAATALLAALWPLYSSYLEHRVQDAGDPVIPIPQGQHGWQLQDAMLTDWQPHYLSPRARLAQTYHKDGSHVALYIYAYRQQQQASELVTSLNVLVSTRDKSWGKVAEHMREPVPGIKGKVQESQLRSSWQRLLVWHWYRVDGHYTANPYHAKLLEAWAMLSGRGDNGELIALAAPYEDKPAQAEQALEAFARDMLPQIEGGLTKMSGN